jgi:mono/diheme cytochrome c family protein
MFTVPTGYNFHDPVCKGVDFICWPTVGASSIEYYESKGRGIPGWDKVLLVTTLKRGSLYVATLTADGHAVAGHMSRYFQSENRYRDTAVNPNGKTIYIATDAGGLAEALGGGTTTTMHDPGAILAFTYEGEGGPSAPDQPRQLSGAGPSSGQVQTGSINRKTASGERPQFAAAQSAAGKTAYNANCAVCHGNTMTNGTFGPPLAGEYFRKKWSGRTVRALSDRVKAMPPASPGSLEDDTYIDIMAYILEVNGYPAGNARLPGTSAALERMNIE